jgi:hypothetical protein
MNVAGYLPQIEIERDWRLDELRWLENTGANIYLDYEADQYRRALVVFLYAHFEGFCKFAFLLYINAVNSKGVDCGSASYAIAAASLSDLFSVLRDPSRTVPEFPDDLPKDTELKRFARERHFVQNVGSVEARIVVLSDEIVDVEGNLRPAVLRKILYRLGLSHDLFDSVSPIIDMLLNYRNSISHGALRSGVKRKRYDELKAAVIRVMDDVANVVLDAIKQDKFMR